MSALPPKCIVDTNVPKTANLSADPAKVPQELANCVLLCIEAVDYVIKNGGLVLDAGDEIFDEYRRQLSLGGQPGAGNKFMKWVHQNRWSLPGSDRVTITKNGESYDEFPDHEDLTQFD